MVSCKIDRQEIAYMANKARRELGEDEGTPIDIFALVNARKNMTIVFKSMSKNISGLCMEVDGDNVIGINSTLSYGRQRFTLAHELGHIFLHDNSNVFVCTSNINDDKNKKMEAEANMFASYLLAPYNAFKDKVSALCESYAFNDYKMAVELEQYFGMSRLAVLYRLKDEGYITSMDYEQLAMCSPMSQAMELGYSVTLYKKTDEENQNKAVGNYIRLAKDLKDKELISDGKYEEYMLDGYREDIVFGIGGEENID